MTTYPDNLGSNQTRVLDPTDRSFESVVYQRKKPPLSCEVNLTGRLASDHAQDIACCAFPSGWLNVGPIKDGVPESEALTGDVICSSSYPANSFKLIAKNRGIATNPLIAWVNGMKVVVQGTNSTDEDNIIILNAPPSLGARVDFVFLEVWRKLIGPTDTIYKYGNILYKGTNPPNDLIDPAIDIETSLRIQIQYRIRCVDVDIENYPDGFDPTKVFLQGPLSVPLSGSYYFTQIAPGLWRAGTGDSACQELTNTVDGYTYAIPMFAVVRRNTCAYSPGLHMNGSGRSLNDYRAGKPSDRPDNKYNDWIVADDILDMRHRSVFGEDIEQLAKNAFNKIIRGKALGKITKSTLGEDHYGVTLTQVDSISNTDQIWSNRIGTGNGIRRIFAHTPLDQNNTLERKTGIWNPGVSTSITTGYSSSAIIKSVEEIYVTGSNTARRIYPFPYVAVTSSFGGNSYILTSRDGINWNLYDTGSSYPLLSITIGGQILVIGGDSFTSFDGETWTQHSLPDTFNSVTWNVDKFVAVGPVNAIYTSPDGVSWTQHTTTNNSLYSVIWGGNQFVAAGSSGQVHTSPDGITWTARTTGTSEVLYGIAWSNSGLYVAVGSTGTILTSPDAVTWTSRINPDPSLATLRSVVFNGSQFVAVGDYGTSEAVILTSTDGITWTLQSSGSSYGLRGVSWTGDQFIAAGDNGTIITSPDGITWTAQTSGISEQINAVHGGHVILSNLGTNTVVATILTSNLRNCPLTFDYTIHYPGNEGFTNLPETILEFRKEEIDSSSYASINSDIRVRTEDPIIIAPDQTRFSILSNRGGSGQSLYDFGHQMFYKMVGNGTNQYIFDRTLYGYPILGIASLHDGTKYCGITSVVRNSTQYTVITDSTHDVGKDLTFGLYTGGLFFQTSRQGRGITDTFEMAEYTPEEASGSGTIYHIDSVNKMFLKLASDQNSNGTCYAYVDGTRTYLTTTNREFPTDSTKSRITIEFSSAPPSGAVIEVPALTRSAISSSEGYACFYTTVPYQGLLDSSAHGTIEAEGPAIITTAGSGAITNIVRGTTGTAVFLPGETGITGYDTNWSLTAKAGYLINSWKYPDLKYMIREVVSDSSLSLTDPLSSKFGPYGFSGFYDISIPDQANFNQANIVDRLPTLHSYNDASACSENINTTISGSYPVLETRITNRVQDVMDNPIDACIGINSADRGRSTVRTGSGQNLELKFELLDSIGSYQKIYQSYVFNKDNSGELYLMIVGGETQNNSSNVYLGDSSDSVDIFRMPGRPLLIRRNY